MSLKFNLKLDKNAKSKSVAIPFPETFEKLIEAGWTQDHVFAHCQANCRVKAQGWFRTRAKRIADGKDVGPELKTEKQWVEHIMLTEKLTSAERTQKNALQESDDEKRALIAALQESMK